MSTFFLSPPGRDFGPRGGVSLTPKNQIRHPLFLLRCGPWEICKLPPHLRPPPQISTFKKIKKTNLTEREKKGNWRDTIFLDLMDQLYYFMRPIRLFDRLSPTKWCINLFFFFSERKWCFNLSRRMTQKKKNP